MSEFHNEHLVSYRKNAQLTQREMITLLGMEARALISHWEHNGRVPDFQALMTYRAIFDLPVNESLESQKQKLGREVAERIPPMIAKLRTKKQTRRMRYKIEFLETTFTRLSKTSNE